MFYVINKLTFFNPLTPQEDTGVPFHRNFNSILRRDHQKNSYEGRAYEQGLLENKAGFNKLVVWNSGHYFSIILKLGDYFLYI